MVAGAIGTNEKIYSSNVHLRNYCGPNCLTVFLKLEGIEAELEDVASVANTDTTGTTLMGLAIAAREKGVNALGVEVASIDALKEFALPAILSMNPRADSTPAGVGHFILAVRYYEDGALIVDPPRKSVRVSYSELSKQFSGVALLLSKQSIHIDSRSSWSFRVTEFILVCLAVLGLLWIFRSKSWTRHFKDKPSTEE